MNFSYKIICVVVVSLICFNAKAEIKLRIKIDRIVDSKSVEFTRNVSANYNQDIIVDEYGLKDKIVINLKKFQNMLVHGMKINPVQIEVKVIDSSKKTIGKTLTVTSFYNNSAHFAFPDRSVSLDFKEI